MSYVSESGASTSRRRRRRRTAITLTLVVLLLGGSLLTATAYVKGWLGAPPPPPSTACVPRTSAVRPAQVRLNVYNATQRNGLARKTAGSLKARGFRIATIGNDPLARSVTGPAEVRYGKAGLGAASLVAAQVRGAKLVRDGRSDASLDLVVGEKFTALATYKPPSAKVAPKPTKHATTKPGTKPGTKATTAAASRTPC